MSVLNLVSSVSCLVVLHRVPERVTEDISEIASGEKIHLVSYPCFILSDCRSC